MWRGKKFSELSDSEVEAALGFYQKVLEEIHNDVPTAIWGFFSQQISDLTLIQFNRLLTAA